MIRHNGLPLNDRAMLPSATPDLLTTRDCCVCGAKVPRQRRPYCLKHSEYAQRIMATVARRGRQRA